MPFALIRRATAALAAEAKQFVLMPQETAALPDFDLAYVARGLGHRFPENEPPPDPNDIKMRTRTPNRMTNSNHPLSEKPGGQAWATRCIRS